MRIYDIIHKKRNGEELTDEEIRFFVAESVGSKIKDYQITALLMAVCFNGMTERETATLTMEMAKSGDMVDLSEIEGYTVDKHSTGGVGDKTTLIVTPIVASLGGKVAKMSGRGLGHTGGTVDKLESIEGFRTTLSGDEFLNQVNKIGLCVVGQSGDLAPADKKFYALRNDTATVDCIPLIASSIMSKKLAAGSKGIVLDVKTGSGAFMKSVEESEQLAEAMVKIGKAAGRDTVAVITNMDIPLGNAVGNSLEVIEAVETLKGNGAEDLTTVCVELASNMLTLVTGRDKDACTELAKDAIADGSALEKLKEMVREQGGNPEWIADTALFPKAKHKCEIKAESDGYIEHMDAEKIGVASLMLGAGRNTKEDELDFSAGIILQAKTGDKVIGGETIATLYANDESKFESAVQKFNEAIEFSSEPVEKQKLIYSVIR
ncbi:MAG: pyrimidine-nucleoside phosphorylase [Clostridia bacterium]|nr:pyrimidine-nucleoside phosphorylase [Clostridia bacterium]